MTEPTTKPKGTLTKDSEWMALAAAAMQLGINRERLLRLVQSGIIEGRRNLTDRWEVRRSSLERYERRND